MVSFIIRNEERKGVDLSGEMQFCSVMTRPTTIGSLGTLVMSGSSSTPTITVGNSHFFTGQQNHKLPRSMQLPRFKDTSERRMLLIGRQPSHISPKHAHKNNLRKTNNFNEIYHNICNGKYTTFTHYNTKLLVSTLLMFFSGFVDNVL